MWSVYVVLVSCVAVYRVEVAGFYFEVVVEYFDYGSEAVGCAARVAYYAVIAFYGVFVDSFNDCFDVVSSSGGADHDFFCSCGDVLAGGFVGSKEPGAFYDYVDVVLVPGEFFGVSLCVDTDFFVVDDDVLLVVTNVFFECSVYGVVFE